MGKRISMTTREELVAAIKDRYGASGRAEKSRIPNEFVAVTGYQREHAIRLLRERSVVLAAVRRIGVRLYGAEIRYALIVLRETSDRVCSKRLRTADSGVAASAGAA